ncbi:MAG: S1C family serine protease [Bacteroidia bacterium]
MKKSQILLITILFVCASFSGAWIFNSFFNSNSKSAVITENKKPDFIQNVSSEEVKNVETGFITASKISTPSVVFIKTESQYQRQSFWGFGFDPFGRIGKVGSTGSGVIISEDGYIVTNQHVIKSADKIEVVLSNKNKTLKAKLIGSDPSSDLALLKVETSNLTPIRFTNSDDVQIGQWVLAVGNPFNLTSTVTAGIVSAKGRNINIVNNQFPLESFIQTDAAINPGNSGGALVNLDGDLVGVNTAIASKTGSYVGYGFAIPSNIVAKIIDDLKNYGEVQKGYIGIDVTDVEGGLLDKLKAENGVMISRLTGTNKNSDKLLEAGDIILQVNGIDVDSKATFDERISYLRPGDIAHLEIIRDGNRIQEEVILVNKQGTTELLKRESVTSETLGAEFEKISNVDKKRYGIDQGIKISNITNGKIRKMNLSEGFIFVKVNNLEFDNAEELISFLENHQGHIRIEGVSDSGAKQFLSFTFY